MATTAKEKAGRGRPAVNDKSFIHALEYCVISSYQEWITRSASASASRSSVSGLIDQVVAKYSHDIGVTDPPPDRTV